MIYLLVNIQKASKRYWTWPLIVDFVRKMVIFDSKLLVFVCFQKASVEGLQGIHLNMHQLFPQLFRQLFKSFNNCLLHCFICSGIASKVLTIYKIFLQKHRQMFLMSSNCLKNCNNFRQNLQKLKHIYSTGATIWTRSCLRYCGHNRLPKHGSVYLQSVGNMFVSSDLVS